MSGATTELSLATAVDADDNADYLTIALANSLRTVDALFNNVTGHNHNGAHQGGTILTSSLKGAFDIQDWYRSTGHSTPFPTTGAGLEMYYDATQGGTLQAYNRTTSAWLPIFITGSVITLSIAGNTTVQVRADGSVVFAAAITVTTGGIYALGGVVYFGPQATSTDTYLQRASAGVLQTNGGFVVNGPLNVTGAITGATVTAPTVTASTGFYATGGLIYFGASSDAYLQRAGVNALQTSGAFTVNGTLFVTGAVTLQTTLVASGTIQGTTITATGDLIAAAQHRARGGGHYFGPTDQTFLQMWNPGELRLSSTPGNFYALGTITAEGGPVTGKGAYVNSASSETVKTNVAELDAETCLGQVLDGRMRPVSFEYIEPMAQRYMPQASPDDPRQPVAWTPERLGFIAEEVARVIPQAAGVVEGGTLAHGLSVEALIPILWGAVRALNHRVQTLEGGAA